MSSTSSESLPLILSCSHTLRPEPETLVIVPPASENTEFSPSDTDL